MAKLGQSKIENVAVRAIMQANGSSSVVRAAEVPEDDCGVSIARATGSRASKGDIPASMKPSGRDCGERPKFIRGMLALFTETVN